ncbi:MAG: HNH endonuclease [Henriciella sp.]
MRGKTFVRRTLKGECIYCQKRSKALTKEHIIPRGLGGNITLRSASCPKCQKVIHKYETKVMRECLGPGRYKLGIRSRSSKDRPTTFPAIKAGSKGAETVDIPLSELPFFMLMPVFKTWPTLHSVISADHEPAPENGIILIGRDMDLLNAKLKEHSAEGLDLKFDLIDFGRMLAKIALGYCVKEFGYGRFIPFTGAFVTNEHNGFTQLISSSVLKTPAAENPFVPTPGYNHSISHLINRGKVYVKIELFSNLGAPAYYVQSGILDKGNWYQVSWS